MPYLVKNNRIFIDIPNQPNSLGLDLHSQLSHVCRKILKIVLNVFCFLWLCNKKGSISFFSFETFEAKVEGKIFYLRKEQYFKLKKAYQPNEKQLPNFAEDLIKTIRGNVVNVPLKLPEPPPKLDQPALEDQVKKDEEIQQMLLLLDQKEIQDSIKDPHSLCKFFKENVHANKKKWEDCLALVKQEVLEETIQILDQEKFFDDVTPLKKMYSSASHDQKASLIKIMTSPEALAGIFPDDIELRAKVAEKIFANPDSTRNFFEKVNKNEIISYLFDKFPLTKQLLSLFPQDLQGLSDAAKNNLFGLELNPVWNIDAVEMINIIFKTFSYEKAEAILLSYMASDQITTAFGLKLLTQAFQELNPENEKNVLSNRMILFSFKFVKELQKANKYTIFLEEMQYYIGVPGMLTKNMEKFINCSIIGALRSPKAVEILDLLYKHSLFMIFLNPTQQKPNEVLENHLTPEQKQKYLNWAQQKSNLKNAQFKN